MALSENDVQLIAMREARILELREFPAPEVIYVPWDLNRRDIINLHKSPGAYPERARTKSPETKSRRVVLGEEVD